MSAGLPSQSVSVSDLFADANRKQSAGALNDAESAYLALLEHEPQHADSLNQLGVIAYRQGRHDRAIGLIRSAIILFPGAAPLYFNSGLAAQAAGQSEDALSLYHRAQVLKPGNADALCNIGNVLQFLSRPADAESAYRAALRAAPFSSRVHYNFALALKARGDRAAAEDHYRAALVSRPDYADALANLGSELLGRRDLSGAVILFNRTARLDRTAAETQFNLANLHRSQLRSGLAIEHYRACLALDPAFIEAGAALAFTLKAAGRLHDAFKVSWRMMTLRPREDSVHVGLADTLLEMGAVTDAADFYRKALVLRPHHPDALNNLANTEKAQGLLDRAVTSLARAIAIVPDFALAHSNLVFTQLYRPETGLAEVLSGAIAWNQAQGCPDIPGPAIHRDVQAPPRIGFISADFRTHVVANLVIPTVEALHRRGHHLTLYGCHPDPDSMTERFKAASSRWRDVADLSDPDLARLLNEDGIDILIDLAGHTAGNRMSALARRLAPIQASWVGYPATTGIPAIDYFLADPVQIPDRAIPYYAEKIIRFPDSYVCYEPVAGAPDTTPPPFLRNGFITFGSFNENVKVTDAVLAAWARILANVPGSRLLFKSIRFDDPGTLSLYASRLTEAGCDIDRIDFIGRTTPQGHLAAMADADIALDSFPYTGGATTLETLWMGVPVIALPGETLASRHSCGYLTCLGLTDFIAASAEDYVAIASGLAQDRARLHQLRDGLRLRMMMSPLCDRHRFADAFESAIDTMWRRHCVGERPRSFDIAVPHHDL